MDQYRAWAGDAAAALQRWYNPRTGLWKTAGWWNSANALIGVLWPLLLIALSWYLYNRLSPDVPAVLAATCALTFAWVLVAPWSLPWYTAVAWVTLALLPRNSLTRWLTLATLVTALLHFSAGQANSRPGGPAPTP